MRRCQHCGGNVLRGLDELACLQCGRPVTAPPAASEPKRCFRGHLLTAEYWFCQVCRSGAR